MTLTTVSTDVLPPKDQFAAWQAWFQPVFTVEPTRQDEEGFLARCMTWKFDSAMLSRVSTPAIKVKRDNAMVRRDHLDHWNIAVGLGGAMTGLQAGDRDCTVPSGVPFILSLGSAVSSERAADERLQLYFPRDQFANLNASLDVVSGRPLNTPLGKLLADFLLLLERNLPEISIEDRAALNEALRSMLAACIGPTRDRLAEAQTLTQLTMMERIRVAVRKRIASPRLGPAMLCRDVGLSRSQLYRILESDGGVARYIQRFRLQEIFALLSDVTVSKSITIIATEHGFCDPSSFSRVFRREFGVTPSEVRASARDGILVPQQSKPIFAADLLTLRTCLQTL